MPGAPLKVNECIFTIFTLRAMTPPSRHQSRREFFYPAPALNFTANARYGRRPAGRRVESVRGTKIDGAADPSLTRG
jgi:hypothetical protein